MRKALTIGAWLAVRLSAQGSAPTGVDGATAAIAYVDRQVRSETLPDARAKTLAWKLRAIFDDPVHQQQAGCESGTLAIHALTGAPSI